MNYYNDIRHFTTSYWSCRSFILFHSEILSRNILWHVHPNLFTKKIVLWMVFNVFLILFYLAYVCVHSDIQMMKVKGVESHFPQSLVVSVQRPNCCSISCVKCWVFCVENYGATTHVEFSGAGH